MQRDTKKWAVIHLSADGNFPCRIAWDWQIPGISASLVSQVGAVAGNSVSFGYYINSYEHQCNLKKKCPVKNKVPYPPVMDRRHMEKDEILIRKRIQPPDFANNGVQK